MQIVEKYSEWAADYQENQITIVYDTMWNGTKKIAEFITEGIRLADPMVEAKVFNLAKSDINDVITEIFKSKTTVLGSPTINKGILHSMAGLAHLMAELKFRNKKAAAFGCYGWSGESVKILNDLLTNAGFALIGEGFRNQWNPDETQQANAIEFGRMIAKA
jgi:flavorubredoxin